MSSLLSPLSEPLDYDTLYQEGIRWLERLAGPDWTDFNAHDPGITFLEALCYALSDLAYRAGHDVPDLFWRSGRDLPAGMHAPERVLVSEPVTLADLRCLALDVEGVRNAWVETVAEPEPPLYFVEKPAAVAEERVLTLGKDKEVPEGGQAVAPRGRVRIGLEKSAAFSNVERGALERAVAERLHASRPLGLDIESITVLQTQPIRLQARVEIHAGVDPEEVYIAVLGAMEDYVSPTVPVHSLAERLAAGLTADEIYLGPRLERGFIDTAELQAVAPRDALRTSDLVREIMAVSGVRMAEYVGFLSNDGTEDWSLPLERGKSPALELEPGTLRLQSRGGALHLDTAALQRHYLDRRNARARQRPAESAVPAPPVGRNRNLARHESVMAHLPAVYGVGEAGLPAGASAERQAAARQLKAYLLFFDQFLANGFAQLAHVAELLDFGETGPDTYFAGIVEAPDCEDLWRQPDRTERGKRLARLASPETRPAEAGQPVDWRRKQRFLDHLLARFAEPLTDFTRFRSPADGTQKSDLARAKQEFLRRYPELSGGRGRGANLWMPGLRSGLEERLRLKLGLADMKPPGLYLVEHILLRPTSADAGQATPVLAGARYRDPYSLRLSLVMPAGLAANDGYRRFAEQTVRDETPAHLAVTLLWLETEAFEAFGAAYAEWQQRQGDFRRPGGTADPLAALRLRAARDRVIDLLDLGLTYPLTDLAVESSLKVALKAAARICINPSQWGVNYRLLARSGKKGSGKEFPGNGGELEITTPPMAENDTFTILARKDFQGRSLQATLAQVVVVNVGLDTELGAAVLADLLDPSRGADGDARLVAYGDTLRVEVRACQKGVDYTLEDAAGNVLSLNKQRGKLETITLATGPVFEDVELRVRATRTYGSGTNAKTDSALLTTILPVKVRANPDLAVTVRAPVVDRGGRTGLVLAGTQASASYQAFVRPVPDLDWLRDALTPADLRADVSAAPGLAAGRPAWSATGAVPEGFQAVGEGKRGNGGDLVLDLGALSLDSLILVQARKNHQAGDKTLDSNAQLRQAQVVLVRPDPTVGLRLSAAVADGALQAPIRVLGGQPGVLYRFRLVGADQDLAPPVYFHQRDPADSGQNKGLGQLAVSVDFVITAPPAAGAAGGDPARRPPELAELESAPLRLDASLSITAVKVQTGVSIGFERKVADLATQLEA